MTRFLKPFMLAFLLMHTLAAHGAPSITPVRETPAPPYDGTPGAEIRSLEFNDGMQIKLAHYRPDPRRRTHPDDPTFAPIALIAGFNMDISYLHMLASSLARIGYPTTLIQPPGNGEGEMRSQLRYDRDGFHNSAEGFASMYLDGIAEVLRTHYGQPVLFAGHSRAGYIIRFFMSGLRYEGTDRLGRPVLEPSPLAMEAARGNILGLISLYSPLRPDPRLVEAANRMPEMFERLEHLDSLAQTARRGGRTLNGLIAASVVAWSPLNWMLGAVNPTQAFKNVAHAHRIGQAIGEAEANVVERITHGRVADVLLGQREITRGDRQFLRMMRDMHGPELVPSVEELEASIEHARWMMGEGVDPRVLMHLLKYSTKRPPPETATQEMSRLSNAQNLSGWTTQGVSREGKTYSILKAIAGSQRRSALPYFVLSASGDGNNQGDQEELRLLRARETFVVQGGHGGAVLGVAPIIELERHLGGICNSLLTER